MYSMFCMFSQPGKFEIIKNNGKFQYISYIEKIVKK